MQVTPVNSNNSTFQALKVSSRTLKSMGCKKEDFLKNEFINRFSKEYDISITGENSSFFKRATSFCFSIGEASKDAPSIFKFTFKSPKEVEGLIDGFKNKFYWLYSTRQYNVAYSSFKDLDSGDPSSFIAKMDDIMQMVSGMPDTPEYADLRTYIILVLQKLKFWKPMPNKDSNLPKQNQCRWWNVDFSKSVALRALENNNLELLKFLKSKGENLNECLDLLEKGHVSDEVKKILEGVQRQDSRIFELENCYDIPLLREQFFKENADIDINSRNENGDTLALKAVKEKNLDFIKFLSTLEDVDWNAYDANGENIIMHIVKSLDFPLYHALKSIAPKINAGNYSIRDYSRWMHISSKREAPIRTLNTPLEYLIEADEPFYMESLLDLYSGINVMDSSNEIDKPPVFRAMDKRMFGIHFRTLISHPSFDIRARLRDGRDILRYAEESPLNFYTRELSDSSFQIVLNDLVKQYKDTGEITLEQIDALLDLSSSYSENRKYHELITKTYFNSLGDTLPHLLCDFNVDENDFDSMLKMSRIVQKLCRRLEFNPIKSFNEINQSPLSKAIEYENVGLIKLFLDLNLDNSNFISYQLSQALRNCTNQKILDLFKDRGVL